MASHQAKTQATYQILDGLRSQLVEASRDENALTRLLDEFCALGKTLSFEHQSPVAQSCFKIAELAKANQFEALEWRARFAVIGFSPVSCPLLNRCVNTLIETPNLPEEIRERVDEAHRAIWLTRMPFPCSF